MTLPHRSKGLAVLGVVVSLVFAHVVPKRVETDSVSTVPAFPRTASSRTCVAMARCLRSPAVTNNVGIVHSFDGF